MSRDILKPYKTIGAIIMLGYACILHVMPFFLVRSLYIDEAMLASSILTRTFRSIPATPLDWDQSAPIGYLYIVKLFSIIGEGSETSLRLWSLLSFFGTAVLLYIILKKMLKLKYTPTFVIVFLLLPYFVRYSSEAKQYMSDCFFVMLTLLIYLQYVSKQLSLRIASVFFSIIIWFSFSATLFVGGCMMLISIKHVINDIRNKKAQIKEYFFMIIVLISFVLCYFFWLRQTRENAGDLEYWNYLRFPLIPKNYKDFELIHKMNLQILTPFRFGSSLFFFMGIFLLIMAVMCVKERQGRIVFAPIGMGLVLTLIASSYGYFPIQDRIVQFISVILIITMAIGFNVFCSCIRALANRYQCRLPIADICGVFFSLVLIELPFLFSLQYCLPEKIYLPNSEISKSVSYLQDYCSDNDMIYVNLYSIPVFDYEMNYEFHKINSLYGQIKPIIHNNIIYGSEIVKKERESPYEYNDKVDTILAVKEAEFLKDYDSVYLFTSHINIGVYKMITELKKYGKVICVSDYYNTKLFYYIRD